MTEAEWNACTDPQPMLEFLRGKVSERKLRLFACACLREYDRLMAPYNGGVASGLEVSERFADGLASHSEWWHKTRVLYAFGSWSSADAHIEAISAVTEASSTAGWHNANSFNRLQEQAELDRECDLARCIFGPISSPSVSVSTQGPSDRAATLAKAIYADRAFDRLPILADALEDAGCTNHDILAHCRGPGPHVRGCWVVDLLLGKQ